MSFQFSRLFREFDSCFNASQDGRKKKVLMNYLLTSRVSFLGKASEGQNYSWQFAMHGSCALSSVKQLRRKIKVFFFGDTGSGPHTRSSKAFFHCF